MTIIKKFEPEEEKKKAPKLIFFGVVLILLALVMMEIWVKNTVVGYGEKFDKVASLQQQLKIENQILENKIAKDSSLENIASKSADLGLSEPKSIQYLH